jgi:hypothetical protein
MILAVDLTSNQSTRAAGITWPPQVETRRRIPLVTEKTHEAPGWPVLGVAQRIRRTTASIQGILPFGCSYLALDNQAEGQGKEALPALPLRLKGSHSAGI